MRSIQKAEPAELDFHDFDSLLATIEFGDDAAVEGALVPLDEYETQGAYRVREYVGPPSSEADCPHCGLGGGYVDSDGFFTCERCDYFNWQTTRETDCIGYVESYECPDADDGPASVGAPVDRRALDVDSYFDALDLDDGLSSGALAELHADDLKLLEAA